MYLKNINQPYLYKATKAEVFANIISGNIDKNRIRYNFFLCIFLTKKNKGKQQKTTKRTRYNSISLYSGIKILMILSKTK